MQLSVIGCFGFADPDPGQTLAAWAELVGVRLVQAYRNPANEPSDERMRAWAEGAGLRIDSIHGLFGPEFDPSSPDDAVRKFSVETYRREGELVRRLGGDRVVVHPSPAMEGYDGRDRGRRWTQLERSINELSEVGESLGVEFLLENQPPYHPVGADTAELIAAIGRCRKPSIGFCFDTGHAHLNGDEKAALRSVGPLLRYVHASDNRGREDEHQLCFDGTVDWAGIGRELAGLSFDGPFMFEVFFAADEVRRKVTGAWLARLREALRLAPPAGKLR